MIDFDKILKEMPNDDLYAILFLLGIFNNSIEYFKTSTTNQKAHEDLLQFYALYKVKLKNTSFAIDLADLGQNADMNIRAAISIYKTHINRFTAIASSRNLKDKYNDYINAYEFEFSKKFFYEFTEGDFEKIQVLINELRSSIDKSPTISDEHKRRLLLKLEKVQNELHKKVSTFDTFWGLFAESGILIGKWGKDVKPVVDRIREIAGIVWRTQANAEELPSDSPLSLVQGDDNAQ